MHRRQTLAFHVVTTWDKIFWVGGLVENNCVFQSWGTQVWGILVSIPHKRLKDDPDFERGLNLGDKQPEACLQLIGPTFKTTDKS